MTKNKITFMLNGNLTETTAHPSRKLLHILREDLELTGTKEGCGKGHCGTCTVLLDDRAVLSCLTPISKVAGRRVTTIEGVGAENSLHPIQQAFVETGAVQCGFCTPGMVITARALLGKTPLPTEEEIRKGFSRNLCRCTGYQRIVKAVQLASARLRGESVSRHTLVAGGVGDRVVSVDAIQKAAGITQYAADRKLKDMLTVKVLRSPYAHARILNIDVSPAQSVDGVVGIFTGHDIPGLNTLGYMDPKDHPVLATDKVRHVGDPVVLVAGESADVAEAALQRIEVTYAPLPTLSNAKEALREDAPDIHEKGNLLMEKRIIKGEVSIGFSEAEAVVENTYVTPFIEHAYLEPEAGIGYLDDSGRIVIESGSQDSHHIQSEIALFLGIPHERLRATQIPVGGAFGGKIDVSVQCFLALVVHKLRRPAKMVYSREESFMASTKRHHFCIRLKHGAMKTGQLTALEGDMVVDTGAYASWGRSVLVRGLIHGTGPYEIPHVSLNGKLVYTNNPPAGAMRGFGVPQMTFAIESQMDLLAEELHLDPWEIRYRNALRRGSSTATGQVLGQGVGMRKTLSAVREFGDKNAEIRSLPKTNREVKRGRGYGSMFYGIGYTAIRNPSPIEIEITEDGYFHIYSGAVDMGQGTATFLKQIAAEDLGAPFKRIRVTLADTDLTLDSRTTCASRTVYYSGNALRLAISSMKEAMFEVISDLAGSVIDSFDIDGDHLRAGDFAIPMTDLCRLFQERTLPLRFQGIFDPEVTGLDENGMGSPYVAYAYATQMADVDVDLETGEVRVLRIVSAHDVGRAINPLLIEEQIEGAVVMGLGYALMEEFVSEKSVDFREYKIPRFKDTPEIVSLIVEERDPRGPFGAKGIAECALIPTAACITNAIADALGKRVYRLPADPSQMRALIRSRR